MEHPASALAATSGTSGYPRVSIGRPDLTALERENIQTCLATNWISQGPFVREAEAKLKKITGRKYAICTSSGTSALYAALIVSKGIVNMVSGDLARQATPDRVRVPALTFTAVHNVVRLTGGIPIYLDSDMDSWQVCDSEWAEFAGITSIAAPCYGKLEGMDVAPRFMFIEDCSESFGGHLNGAPAGSFGLMSCVSFYANKIVTAGEGGAVLTDSAPVAEHVRLLINHGIVGTNYEPTIVGFNGRMTDLQAAVLCGQLDRLPEMLARRRAIMAEYRSAARTSWRLPTVAPGEITAPWLFAGIPENRQAVKERAQFLNVETRPLFPVPADAPCPTARLLSGQGMCLPLSSALTDEEVDRVCDVIRA